MTTGPGNVLQARSRVRWIMGIVATLGLAGGGYYAAQPRAAPFVPLANGCAPPPGLVIPERPAFDAGTRFVAQLESIEINASLAKVLGVVEAMALTDAIAESDLPHVTGTYDLTPARFGSAGSRRMTCLSDGSFLVEQVLRKERSETHDMFVYEVWNYTSPTAGPVAFSVGEFDRRAIAPDRTRTQWKYSFKLREDRFPGDLGALGRFAFRKAFLERSYAQMMRSSLEHERRLAEAR